MKHTKAIALSLSNPIKICSPLHPDNRNRVELLPVVIHPPLAVRYVHPMQTCDRTYQ